MPAVREAVVEESDLRVRRAQERRGVLVEVGREPPREHRLLGRLAAEERGQLADRAAVGDRGRDVRPLARVGALREEPAELVERRRPHAQEPVRVLVDERDLAQYFEK